MMGKTSSEVSKCNFLREDNYMWKDPDSRSRNFTSEEVFQWGLKSRNEMGLWKINIIVVYLLNKKTQIGTQDAQGSPYHSNHRG